MPFTRPEAFTTRPTLQGTFGMSASTHWLSTATAQAVLERGGNAFDAAVAGAFVLHVVEPHLNGPGGDMTGIFVTADRPDQPIVLMGQGPAPAGATVEHYVAEGLDLVPGSGALAAAVPAAVDAWLLLLRDHGTWELDAVLDFAIGYARDGHPMLGRVGTTIAAVSALFQTHWPTSAELWMPGGRIPAEGELVWNPAYARTLERLVEAGVKASTREAGIDAARREWREGFVARAMVDAVQTPHRHSSGTDHRGVLALADLAGFEAGYEAAATVEFRGHTIAKTGPWGQGPALLQTLAILSGFEDHYLDPSTELGAHTILEAQKLALADREAYYGDTDVPLDYLLSEQYCAGRRALITDRASHDFRPGTVPGREPYLPPLRTDYTPPALAENASAAGLGVGEPTVTPAGETRGDTCHIDVVDRWGNMVSATPSGGGCSPPRRSGTGLLPGHPAANDVAGARDTVHADARETPAHHIDADPRAARRPRRDRAGFARRRPAGPMATAVPAADHRGRLLAAAGHRCADVPYDVDARVVLAAHLGARRRRRRGPAR